MKFKERLEKMVASGAITNEQANGFESGIASITMPVSAGIRAPVSKLPFVAGLALCVGISLYAVMAFSSGDAESVQKIQDVAQSINLPGSTGKIGGGMSALVTTVALGLPLIGTLAFFLPFLHNRFVDLEAEMDAAKAHLESCHQKRADLLSNLVIIVRDYLGQEKTIHGDVSQARDAEKLFALVEEYPELQASENVKKLQTQFEATEDQVNVARMYHNDAVRDYNKAIGKLPGNLVASLCGFKPRAYFEAGITASKAVNV